MPYFSQFPGEAAAAGLGTVLSEPPSRHVKMVAVGDRPVSSPKLI